MSNPLNYQVGGSHYSQMKIQPIEFAHKNGLGPCETLVLKYICRWRGKDGLRDLEKAIHCLQILIEMETNAQKAQSPRIDKDALARIQADLALKPKPAYGAADLQIPSPSASLGGYIPEDP
jgi:hypothetical protein